MATALGLALISKALSNRFIASEPIVAVAAGVIFGPFVLGWVSLTAHQRGLCSSRCRG